MKNFNSEAQQTLLTAGEMAKLCGTTKATLYHYEKEGILQPFQIGENGYRYYRINQIYSYEGVRVLQQQGLSLEEVREYLNRQSYPALQELLESMSDTLAETIRVLTWKRELVENTKRHLRELETDALAKPQLRAFPARRYLVTPSVGHMANALHQHNVDRRTDRGQMDLFISGMILPKDYLAGETGVTLLCSEIGGGREAEQASCSYETLPAGKYAVVRLKWGDCRLIDGVSLLLTYLREQALCPEGPMLVDELIDPLSNANHEDAIYTLSVRAERD